MPANLPSKPLSILSRLEPKRIQVWQTPVAQRTLEEIRTELRNLLSAEGLIRARELMDDRLSQLSIDGTPEGKLQWALHQLAMVEGLAEVQEQSLEDFERRWANAYGALNEAGVCSAESRLYWLVEVLRRARSEAYERRGEYWLARWNNEKSHEEMKPSVRREGFVWLEARNPSRALQVWDGLHERDLNIYRSRCLRLLGDPFAASQLLIEKDPGAKVTEKQSPKKQPPEKKTLDVPVERFFCELQLGAKRELGEFWRTTIEKSDWPQVSPDGIWGLKLLSYALAGGQTISALPSVRSLKRKGFGTRAGSDQGLLALIQFIETLEFCYLSPKPLDERVDYLGLKLKTLSQLRFPDWELMGWAAAARFLDRVRRPGRSQICRERYRELSLALTQQKSADNLRLLADQDSRIHDASLKGWGRTKSYASLTWGVAQILGPKGATRLFQSNPQRARAELSKSDLHQLGILIGEHLRNLRGPAMKLGQILSLSEGVLPREIYSPLERLHDQAQPLAADVVWDEIPVELRGLICDFEDVPLGTGSVSQVHRAKLKTGETVALKVRTPGVGTAVNYDMRMLTMLLPLLRVVAPRFPWPAVVKEVSEMIRQELDFEREAQKQDQFHKRFLADSRVAVPAVFLQHCRSNLLVSRLAPGEKMRNFLQDATQAEKDLVGRDIVSFVVRSVLGGEFNTDPHPGNFLIGSDRTYAVDFGSVKQWGPEVLKPWRDLIVAGATQDLTFFDSAFEKMMGLKARESDILKGARERFFSGREGLWTTPGASCLSILEMKDQCQDLIGLVSERLGDVTLPPEYLFGLRVYFGHMALVASIGARQDWASLVREILNSPGGPN